MIVTRSSTPAALATKNETRTIPIVAFSVAQPVAAGIVPSLARPGGNATALASSTPGTFGKKLAFIQAIVSGLRRLAVLVDRTNPLYDDVGWNEIQAAADQAGVGAERIDLQSAEDLDAAFETAESRRVDAILTAQNPLLLPVRARVAELELHYLSPAWHLRSPRLRQLWRSPVMRRELSRDLLACRHLCGQDPLEGARPGDLPVEQPTTFEMAVNVKTLQTLGLTIPSAVLPLVTEWIQ
jgi:putative tryptophan/tyrosine transport system substrate-binding protein